MDDPDKQKEFNKNYEEYEKRIFANFVHEHQFYYVVSVVYNEKNTFKSHLNSMFLSIQLKSSILLNLKNQFIFYQN